MSIESAKAFIERMKTDNEFASKVAAGGGFASCGLSAWWGGK